MTDAVVCEYVSILLIIFLQNDGESRESLIGLTRRTKVRDRRLKLIRAYFSSLSESRQITKDFNSSLPDLATTPYNS